MLPVEDRRVWIKSRRKKRKLTRRARFRRQIFRFALLLSILLAGVMGFTQLPWAVRDVQDGIEIKGNHFTTTAMIRKTLKDSQSVPLYELNPADLERKLERLETVKHAFVRRYSLPQPHMSVEILEEFPWAALARGPEEPARFVISESGRAIPIAKFPQVEVPTLTIYSSKPIKLKPQDVKQWATWLGYVQDQTGRKVAFVDMRRPFDVRIGSDEDIYIKIGIPDTTLTRRLGRLTTIMPTVEKYHDRLEHIDLALENNVPLKLSKEPRTPKSSETTKSEKMARASADGASTPIATTRNAPADAAPRAL